MKKAIILVLCILASLCLAGSAMAMGEESDDIQSFKITQYFQGIPKDPIDVDLNIYSPISFTAPDDGIYTDEDGTEYLCVGWINGTGDIPGESDALRCIIIEVTQNSILTWVYKEVVSATLDTVGLSGLSGLKSDPGFNPPLEKVHAFLKGKTITLSAPEDLTDSDTYRYRCIGWENATGSILSQKGETGNAISMTVELNEDSSLIWVYKEAVSVTLDTDGLPDLLKSDPGFNPPSGDSYFFKDQSVTLSAPSIIKDPNTDGIYKCTGWKDGKGNISSDGSANSLQVILTENSSITWDYKEAVSMEVSIQGLPEGFRPVDGFDPVPGEGILFAVETTLEAPYLIEDTINECFYLLTGFRGTGDLPPDHPISSPQPLTEDAVFSYPTTITIDKTSTMQWVYEKANRLEVTLKDATFEKAVPKVSDPGNPSELIDVTETPYTQYYPENTNVTLTTACYVEQDTPSTRVYVRANITPDNPMGKIEQVDENRKKLSFVITNNTQVEWVYIEATEAIIGQTFTPPNGPPPADWDYASKITKIDSNATDTVENSFFWDDENRELYLVRPLSSFEIDWGDGNPPSTYYSAWPDPYKETVVNAPVNFQPTGAPYTFEELSYSECYLQTGTFQAPSELSQDNPIFQPSEPGRSVIRFSDPNDNLRFLVVKTVELPQLLTKKDWDIGNAIVDIGHNDPEARNGYVYYENAYYDGYGPDKAYDRETRTGPIIPVNASPGDVNSDRQMVVVWYKTDDKFKIGWPVKPVRYNCKWPESPTKIIIASGNGSGPLQEYEYTGQIYYQPDTDKPGYNPNEEHALILGSSVYAIRDDLNNLNNQKTSKPYVLLKYKDLATKTWAMKVFKVEKEDADHHFNYPITAGKAITPLTPMDLLPQTADSYMFTGIDWYHLDHKGGHWAKASNGLTGNNQSKIVMRWYYPLQKGFYYPFTKSDGTPVTEGDSVPFLNGGQGHDYRPADVTYTVSWPSADDVKVLNVGETLTEAKYGLPNLANWAAGEVIFDENVYNGKGPLAKLFDPFTERSVDLDALPEDIRTESVEGKLRFPDLPYSLRSRLFYDPLNKKLKFKGISYDPGIGEPLLLPNVMTVGEKNRLEAFNTAWADKIEDLFNKTRNPNDINLSQFFSIHNPYKLDGDDHKPADWSRLWGVMLGLELKAEGTKVGPQKLVGLPMALTAGIAAGQGYVVLAENDDDSLGAAPVQLHVIRVADGPYQGEIKVIKSDNPFDEKLTLRHSGDFGGEPEKLYFAWYYKPDNTGLPPLLPKDKTDTAGWVLHKKGPGLIDVTIEGAGKLTLSDNWFMVHYYYGNYDRPGDAPSGATYPSLATEADNQRTKYWSKWAGSPGGETAQLAEGWIKRVVSDLNPLDARVKNFRDYQTSTDVSMVSQLGPRYEGDIALNASPDNLNNLGLIEAYETVLNRGKEFSIDSAPPVDYGPANNALLNAATRIADFYTLLGNDAYADAQDPTIGFDTQSGQLGSMASSIFSFQNQLDSLLEEELVLLRGRDDTMSTTRARPVYNRLVWNFTQGNGEVAYVQAYNIFDWDVSGVIDELDAKVMYPQGHGDAWGHYLTAMKGWYSLLRHESYTWEPRVESVMVGGAPVPVDYLDERKFAQTAAAKAKAGAEIVDLTYRKYYVDDPAGQWQGYKDTDAERAWGVDGWARRAGQGAYFDWAVANAMLPAEDPVQSHTGITQIDRTTVPELHAIASEYRVLQAQVNEVDGGLNPLGLAKGVVPFDIIPDYLTAGRWAKTHFEQVYDRAIGALKNAKTLFDYATDYTLMLRSNEDALTDYKRGVEEQERDYWNRLIEVFGYPYEGDIGPGGTYATGYDGPDWIHFNYVNLPDLTGEALYKGTFETEEVVWTATFAFDQMDGDSPDFDDLLTLKKKLVHKKDDGTGEWEVDITYHIDPDSPWMEPPPGWGKRRAPGEIQMALSELIKAHANYKRGLTELEGMLRGIDAAGQILEAKHGVLVHEIEVKGSASATVKGFNYALAGNVTAQKVLARTIAELDRWVDGVKEIEPEVFTGWVSLGPAAVVKTPAIVSATAKNIKNAVVTTLSIVDDALALANLWLGVEKEHTLMSRDRSLFIDDARFEVQQMVKELETMESDVRAKLQELYMLREVIQQAMGRYAAVLAKGERLLTQREIFRKRTAGDIQDYRYQDLSFRVFRNDAVQKYRATFDLAARYAYLAATAYDYETNLLGSDARSGQAFLTNIVRERSPGVIMGGSPVSGKAGLADPLARLSQNFEVYKGQLGFNNPQIETNRFSLRRELFRLKDSSDDAWRSELETYKVQDLLAFEPFRRFCRPFAPDTEAPQPGIAIPFSTEVHFGYNYFGYPLGGGDSAYDPTNFATKVRSVGVWFTGYDADQLSGTPRIYLVPVGADVLRSPSGDGFATREWHVVDQKLPAPFPISHSAHTDERWIPMNDSLSDQFGDIRRLSSFRAYPDGNYSGLSTREADIIAAETTMDSRLIGRSVWNTQWFLIIPGGTLLHDPEAGLDTFIDTVTDIKLFFQTYAYSGN
jgi:hypothetical protein